MLSRRLFSVGLSIAMLTFIAGCGGGGTAPAPQSTSSSSSPSSAPASSTPAASGPAIKLGHIGPLSGPNAYIGDAIMKGVKVAVAEANAEGGLPGNGKIELLIGDDRGTPAEAVALAQKYINEDKVAALIGPFTSATAIAAKDVIHKAQIVMASTGAAADSITDKDVEWYFRPHMYNRLQSNQFAKYIVQTLGKKKLGLIYENNDWGKGLDTNMSALFKEMGAEVVAREGYNTGSTDFSSALTKIKARNPDALIAISLITEAAIVARQAAELGIKGDDIIGLGGFDQDKLFELAGPATNGIKFMMWYVPEHPEIKTAKAFADAFQKEYKAVPDSFAAQGYTAAKSVINAIKKAGSTDRKAIRDAMEKIDFESPIGRITFGPDHNARASVFMAQWKGGKKVLLEKQPKID